MLVYTRTIESSHLLWGMLVYTRTIEASHLLWGMLVYTRTIEFVCMGVEGLWLKMDERSFCCTVALAVLLLLLLLLLLSWRWRGTVCGG